MGDTVKTHTHKPESMPRQYVRVGLMLAGVGFVVLTGLAIEIVGRACKWAAGWIDELTKEHEIL